jgi:hypothetical protein
MNDVTQWFDGKPPSVGVWEVEKNTHGDTRIFQYWNGDHFCMHSPSPNGAYWMKSFKSAYQNFRYRGLAENPNHEGTGIPKHICIDKSQSSR